MQQQNLFDVKKTQIQLARDRGYEISEDEENVLNSDEYSYNTYLRALISFKKVTSIRAALTTHYVNPSKNRNFLVYYVTKGSGSQISSDVIREFVNIITNKVAPYTNINFDEALIITDAKLSTTSANHLMELENKTDFKFQIFFEEDLTYNPTRRIETPRHERLSQEEKEEVLKNLKCTASMLPIIREEDKVVKYYGWSRGDLIRIHRNDISLSVLNPKSINYRIVVRI